MKGDTDKTKFILHGGRVSLGQGRSSFFEEIVRGIPAHGSLLLVYFASRADDDSETIARDRKNFLEIAGEKDLNIAIATERDFLTQIAHSDAVYFRGGSTEKLITTLRKFPDLSIHLKGKTVAGSSAGAYAISTYFSSHYEDAAEKGLGIAPVRVITHFESTTMPPRPGAVDILRNCAPELELVILREGEWKVIYA